MTISESLTFNFNGIDSSEFKIINVHMESGLYTESFFPTRSIIEEKIPYKDKPYFFGFEYETKEIPITFTFLEPWNDKLINDVMHWLYQDYYKPLIFSSDENRIFYAVVNSESTITHAGLKEGYVTLTFRCNSPYAYTNEYYVDYLLENNSVGKDITIENVGDKNIFPTIKFRKIGKGDISIINNSNKGIETKITNLVDNEEIEIDGENEEIVTSLKGGYRYNDFNYNFLELVRGKNHLKIIGDAYFEFTYRGKRW